MPGPVTTLDREIAREGRYLGIPTNGPLADRAIAKRRLQIALVMLACGVVALFAVAAASSPLQLCAVALAGGFGVYAIEQDRRLHRLDALRGDAQRITFVVASELMYSGALAGDRELLDMRAGVGRAAGSLAAALSEVLPAHCTRVRLVGPSGEVPIAAERNSGPSSGDADDTAAALEAISTRAPVRKSTGGHHVLAVPMWRGEDAVGLLESVAPPGRQFAPVDAALVEAFGRGAAAGLLTPRS